jgi:hypothetical protein
MGRTINCTSTHALYPAQLSYPQLGVHFTVRDSRFLQASASVTTHSHCKVSVADAPETVRIPNVSVDSSYF